MKMDTVKCPLLNIGDSVTYEIHRTNKRVTAQVTQFKYDDNCQVCCENKTELALAILSNKDVINPGNSITVNCDECPLNNNEKGAAMKTNSFKWENKEDKLVLTIEFDAPNIDASKTVGSIRGANFQDNLSKVCNRLQEVYKILMDKGFLTTGSTLDLSPDTIPTLTINVLL